MSVAGVVGVFTAFLLRRMDLLPAIGVTVGLSYYRLFREGNSEIVQAFDIGQHYAMIGFVLGVIVLIALADGLIRRKPTWSARGHVAAALIGVVAAMIVVGASTFFGTKGAIGLVIGLTIAPLIVRLTSPGLAWAVAASAALQGAILVVYRPLAWETSLDRDGKLKLLLYLGAGIIVVVAVLWALERDRKVQTIETA
jgi:hypothetical protein